MRRIVPHLFFICLIVLFCANALYVHAQSASAAQQILNGAGVKNVDPSMITSGDAKSLTGGCDIDAFSELKKYGCDRGTIFCSPGQSGRAGLNPSFACRLAKYLAALQQKGCRPQIVSAFRSKEDQQRVCGGSYGTGCASPGTSCHQYGVAVDLKGATIGTGCPAATGQMGTQYGIANGYNVNSPYMRSGGHNQCIEKPQASCKKGDESVCGPALFDSSHYTGPLSYSNPSQGTGSPSSGSPSGGNGFGGSPSSSSQPSSPSSSGGGTGSGGGGSSADQFNKALTGGSSSSPTDTTTTTTSDISAMSLECTDEIAKGEKADVTWQCPAAATASRGLATKGGVLNTRSRTSGTVSVAPTQATSYTVQCLKGTQLLDQKSCMVSVTVPFVEPEISFESSAEEVTKGQTVELTWSAKNVQSCALSGPELESSGKKGTVETDPLVRTTSYILTCKDMRGESVQNEIEVKVVKRAPQKTQTEFTDPLEGY